MIGIDRLIIVGADGNLYEFLHGPRNTNGWGDCCFRNSSRACRAGECSANGCKRIREIFGEQEVWSWRKL